MKKNFILLFLLFSSIISFSQTNLNEAVDFTVTDVEGHEHNLFSYLDAGKYVFIDFFYTTCQPCQQTAPKVNEAYEYFGCNSADLIVLGIDLGNSDEQVIAFDNAFGTSYPAVSGSDGGGNQVCNAYGISSYPTLILIAPDREIVIKDIWPVSNGQYLISLISQHGPQEAECGEVEIVYEDMHQISIYPVPANDFVNIANATDYKLSVYSYTGKTIFEKDITSNEETIDLKDLNTGVYVFKLSKGSDIKSYTVSVMK